MKQWLPAALLSLFSFGLWGLFTKMTIVNIDSKSALIFQTLGVMLVGLLMFCVLNVKLETNIKGVSFGLLTGIAYSIGCLFYFIAAGKGKVTTVVTMTALYPLITIILSYFFLRENMNIKQFAGIGFALLSIFLLSS